MYSITAMDSALFYDPPLPVQLLQSRVCAGFPSPAKDFGAQWIDLSQMLIVHPQANYFLRASGHSMIKAGIFDKDILVVDRAIKPRLHHVAVVVEDSDFTVKCLFQRLGRFKLRSANPVFPDIVPKEGQTIEVWGVVTTTIKQSSV